MGEPTCRRRCRSCWIPFPWRAGKALNPLVGAGIGVLIYQLLVYFWQRTMHRVHWIWRSFHQMHHSAERLDSYGAFYFSPLDIVGFTFLSSLSLTVVGLSTSCSARSATPGTSDPALRLGRR